MRSRRLLTQTLERRQMLAGDVCDAYETVSPAEAESTIDVIENVEFIPLPGPILLPPDPIVFPPLPDGYAPSGDLLEDSGDMVVAVELQLTHDDGDRAHHSVAYIFDRVSDGSLEARDPIELDFIPRTVSILDNQILIIGQRSLPPERFYPSVLWDEPTVVMSISREDTSVATRYQLEGRYVATATHQSTLYLTTEPSIAYIAGFAPPAQRTFHLHAFDTSQVGLSKLAEGTVHNAVHQKDLVDGEIMLIERTNLYHYPEVDAAGQPIDSTNGDASGNGASISLAPTGTKSELVAYSIQGDAIRPSRRALELGEELAYHLLVADDGQSAVAYSTSRLREQSMIVANLIDLSEGQLTLFDSIEIEAKANPASAINGHTFVLSQRSDSLILVNLDLSVDIDSESRVTRVELPDSTTPDLYPVILASPTNDNVFHIARDVNVHATADGTTEIRLADDRTTSTKTSSAIYVRGGTELLTLDVSDLGITSSDAINGELYRGIDTIDAENNRFGFFFRPDFRRDGFQRHYGFGEFDASGEFKLLGRIDVGRMLESHVTPDHLLARYPHELVIWSWDDIENPVSIPLGDRTVDIEVNAVDDHIRLSGVIHSEFDLLANDQIEGLSVLAEEPRIAELINAPSGVILSDSGRTIHVDRELLGSDLPVEFQYVLEVNDLRSTANVVLDVPWHSINDEARAAIKAVIETLADETGVDSSKVLLIHRVAREQLPKWIDEIYENPFAGQPGVDFVLKVGETEHRFVANYDGGVFKIDPSQIQPLMDVSLKIVGADGTAIDRLRVGDEAFINVIADDLRSGGKGVFSVAFDLNLSGGGVSVAGVVEPLDDFITTTDTFSAEGIDELHVFGTSIEPPGEEPQIVARIPIRAVAPGAVEFTLDPAEGTGSELLLYGVNIEIDPRLVTFHATTVNVGPVLEPADTDANGELTASDVLRVINFLGRFGSVSVDALPEVLRAAEAEESATRLETMQRLDTNVDGMITARDALSVINKLARKQEASPEPEAAFIGPVLSDSVLSDFLRDEDHE